MTDLTLRPAGASPAAIPAGATSSDRPTVSARSRLAQTLALPLALEEGRPPRLAAHVGFLALFAVAGFLGWASVATITERAVAQGQIMPAGEVQAIQHLEGGLVSAILVEEGARVAEGQPLLRLSPTGTVADREQLRAREMSLALRAERLRAFAGGRAPDFAFAADRPDLVADQQAIHDIQVTARDERLSVLDRRIEQRRAELASFTEQEEALRRQVEILTEQLDMRRQLLEQGLVSRVVFLETERSVSQASAQLSSLLGEAARAAEALGEAETQKIELRANLASDALEEMGRTTAELAEVREQLAKLDDRVERLEVVAPAAGLVQGLAVGTLGAVVAPGDLLMELVPVSGEMRAEVRLDPRDIGHVQVGDPAVIKVSTYDPMRFGTIDGTIERISASTFTDENGAPFYRGTVALDRAHVGRDGAEHALSPGMVVSADIVTGEKTVMEYLLKPVYRAFDTAMGER
jgi:HlyD family secretion protein/adhesin transport system membrane fusion protein